MIFDIIVYVIVGIIILAGLIGSVLPTLPGPPLVFSGILIFSIWDHFEKLDYKILIFLFGLMIVSVVLDGIASALGVKKAKASNYAVAGGIIGGFIGLIAFGFIGLILGTFIGPLIFELVFVKSSGKKALRAGIGSLLGFLSGGIIKILISVAMVIIFLTRVL